MNRFGTNANRANLYNKQRPPLCIGHTRISTRKTRAKQCKMLNNYLKQSDGWRVGGGGEQQ